MTNYNLSQLAKWAAPAALALSLAFAAVAPAMAQEIPPEQMALARKYVDLTDKAEIYPAILATTAAQTSKLLSQTNPDITDKIDDAIGKTLESYKDKKDDLFNQLARVYASEFTADELNQMITFYSSPTGQKLATLGQQTNKGIGQALQVFTYNFGTEFVSKVRAALKAEGYKL